MKRFERVPHVQKSHREIKELAKSTGSSIAEVQRVMRDIEENEEVWENGTYQVHVRRNPPQAPAFPQLIELSIKRVDKDWIHDWRELQQIKNLLVGSEYEGVQLFPAESRKVDTSNQYYLYVLAEKGLRWPFGMEGRRVVDGTGKREADGTRQRPLK